AQSPAGETVHGLSVRSAMDDGRDHAFQFIAPDGGTRPVVDARNATHEHTFAERLTRSPLSLSHNLRSVLVRTLSAPAISRLLTVPRPPHLRRCGPGRRPRGRPAPSSPGRRPRYRCCRRACAPPPWPGCRG